MRTFRIAAATGATLAVVLGLATPALGHDSRSCPTPAAYTGAGTAGDPLLISTPGNLQQLRDRPGDWSKYARLTADIDMAGASACTWGSTLGTGGTAFTGTLDGDGHVVSGLNIATSAVESYSGFIGYLGANGVVQDLGFTGDVTAALAPGSDFVQAWVGGLVGFTFSPTTITRSWASGHVSATVAAVDGGFAQFGASASLTIGGIVGTSQSTVADVYFTGSLDGEATATQTDPTSLASTSVQGGGIAGNLSLGSISSAYSTAAEPAFVANAIGGYNPTNTVWSGGLVGAHEPVYASANHLLWDSTAWPGNGAGFNGAVGTGTTASGLATFATFGPSGGNWSITDGFPSGTTWGMCPQVNGGMPFLAGFEPAGVCNSAPTPEPTPAPVPAPPSDPAGSTPPLATPTAVADPVVVPLAHLPTRMSLSGSVVTTGTVPSGATSVVQTASGGASSTSRPGVSRRANARVITRCPITTHGATRTFTCTSKLGAGRWTLTTQARNGATVVAASVRRLVVKAATRTAVTG
jgi:hypothetical protein